MIVNFLGMLLVLIGSLFILIASIGVLRFKDLFLQMHAATKAGTFGTGLVLIGVCIQFDNIIIYIAQVLLLIFFIALTSPIAAHAIAKSAHDSNNLEIDKLTKIEEL